MFIVYSYHTSAESLMVATWKTSVSEWSPTILLKSHTRRSAVVVDVCPQLTTASKNYNVVAAVVHME